MTAMQDDDSNNNDRTDTGREVSIVTFYPYQISLYFYQAKYFAVALNRTPFFGISAAAARELVVAAASGEVLRILPPLSFWVSLPYRCIN